MKLKSTPIKITFMLDRGITQKVELLINDYNYMASSLKKESGIEICIKEVEQRLKKIEERLVKE